MLVIPQKVKMKWNNNSRRIYEGDKYVYTFEKDDFEIDIEDIPKTSGANVLIECDLCQGKYHRRYDNYMRQMKSDIKETDDICDSCLSYFKVNKSECFKLILDGKIRCAPKGCSTSFSDLEIKEIMFHFSNKLIKCGEIKIISEMKLKVSKATMNKYGLSSLLKERSIYEILKNIFPELMPWETNTVGNDYYKSKENREKIRLWLINKLYEDKIIESPFDLKRIRIESIGKRYRLTGFFFNCFSGSRYLISNFLFPNVFNEWDFPVSNNFYKSDENKKRALDWMIQELIKDNKIKDESDFPHVLSFNTFIDYGLRWMLVAEFESSPYKCIQHIYPNRWSHEDFNRATAKDGSIMDSKEEALIHNFFIDNFEKSDVKYNGHHCNSSDKWLNSEHNENYYADWILFNNVIIEYFGYYNHRNNQHPRFLNYKEKTKRKIEFFTNLEDYSFVALFPSDLKKNFKGLKEKFNSAGINIEIKSNKIAS